jgi:hypothetical protein
MGFEYRRNEEKLGRDISILEIPSAAFWRQMTKAAGGLRLLV